MRDQDKNNATDRLLDLIRGQEPAAASDASPASLRDDGDAGKDETVSRSPVFRRLAGRLQALRLAKGREITVGVSLRPEEIAVAAADQRRQPPVVLAHLLEPVAAAPGAAASFHDIAWLESDAQKEALGRSLQKIQAAIGGGPFPPIWVTVPGWHVDIHHLDIPAGADDMTGAVMWAARKNITAFDQQKLVLDFTPWLQHRRAGKIPVTIYLTSRRLVEHLRGLFSELGYPLAGFTTAASALESLGARGRLAVPQDTFSHLQIEEHQSFISIFRDRRLEFSRDIKTGLHSILETAGETPGAAASPAVGEQSPEMEEPSVELAAVEQAPESGETAADEELVLTLDEQPEEETGEDQAGATTSEGETGGGEAAAEPGEAAFALELEMAEEPAPAVTISTVEDDEPSAPAPEGSVEDDKPSAPAPEDSEESEPVFDSRALTRLVRQLERTFDYCATNLGIPRPSHLYLGSHTRLGPALREHISTELGIPCSCPDPFAETAAADPVPPPADYQQRRALVTAVGLALSDPEQHHNYLQTYADKQRHRRSLRLNNIIVAVFIVVALALSGLYFWQQKEISKLDSTLAQKQRQLDSLGEAVFDQQHLSSLADKVISRRQLIIKRANRLYPLLLMGQIQDNLLPETKLLAIKAWPLTPAGENRQADLWLRGMVVAPKLEQELFLARYLRRLADLPLVADLEISNRQKRRDQTGEHDLLLFEMEIQAHPLVAEATDSKGEGE
ncbi:MAG: hypothetical protein U5J62_08955 [Desulfurivibrio sp.]|nr:hypothetical protein [Desulfurivibrio sp.]